MASWAGSGSDKQDGRPAVQGLSPVSLGSNTVSATGSARLAELQPQQICDLIQGEIIPRLLTAHSADVVVERRVASAALLPSDVSRFAVLPISLEADELMVEVDLLLRRGVSAEAIFVDLLAASARKMGQMWEEDSCDFVDVTMGLWRLQEVMREVAIRSPSLAMQPGPQRSALFTPMPGEQHSFGALMVEEVFARAGWQSEVLIEPDRHQLLRIVAERTFDLVGLTISCDCPSGDLASLITAIRGVSLAPRVQILIGGRMINANPDLVGIVGADGTAVDAMAALRLAEQLVMKSSQLDCSPL